MIYQQNNGEVLGNGLIERTLKLYFRFFRKREFLTPCKNSCGKGTSSASRFCLNKKTCGFNIGLSRIHASTSVKKNSAVFLTQHEILLAEKNMLKQILVTLSIINEDYAAPCLSQPPALSLIESN